MGSIGASSVDHTNEFVVIDIININGQEVAAGSAIAPSCFQASNDATSFTVCGSNVKVTAHLLTEYCKYGKYSSPVGSCNSVESGCQTVDLKSGYTETLIGKLREVEAC